MATARTPSRLPQDRDSAATPREPPVPRRKLLQEANSASTRSRARSLPDHEQERHAPSSSRRNSSVEQPRLQSCRGHCSAKAAVLHQKPKRRLATGHDSASEWVHCRCPPQSERPLQVRCGACQALPASRASSLQQPIEQEFCSEGKKPAQSSKIIRRRTNRSRERLACVLLLADPHGIHEDHWAAEGAIMQTNHHGRPTSRTQVR